MHSTLIQVFPLILILIFMLQVSTLPRSLSKSITVVLHIELMLAYLSQDAQYIDSGLPANFHTRIHAASFHSPRSLSKSIEVVLHIELMPVYLIQDAQYVDSGLPTNLHIHIHVASFHPFQLFSD